MRILARLSPRRLFRLQKCMVFLLAASFLVCIIIGIGVLYSKDLSGGLLDKLFAENQPESKKSSGQIKTEIPHPETPESKPKDKLEDSRKKETTKKDDKFPSPNYNLHAFYYPWYGNPEFDGKYLHWNHMFIPHWNKVEARKWPHGQHKPPDDIGSNFYPELGPYSSRDPAVMENHMEQLRSAGIGVLAVSWYPPSMADDNGSPWDNMIPKLMDTAHKYDLKVCFHLEPYKTRTHITIKKDVTFLVNKYGNHSAFYKHTWRGEQLPLYYIYDSYTVDKGSWAAIFRPDGALSMRGTKQDGLFIGLLVEEKHKVDLVGAGFDGFYTYFASDGFSYGASTRHWGELSAYAKTNNVMFIPSAGPGYIDVQVRPWNRRNTKGRENGGYYEQSMKAAVAANPQIISITSFNEWHEGTQIERAIPYKNEKFTYKDYKPMDPDYYLSITRKWSFKYAKLLRTLH